MNMRFERNARYFHGNVQLEHVVIAFDENDPSETYFLTINGEEASMSAETFGHLCKIIEAAKAHDSEA